MSEIIKKYRIPFLFICGTALYVCANLQRSAIPGAVFNELQMQWDLAASQVTWFGASFMYVYAVSQLFVGLLCDRYGGARVITAGGALFVTGCFLFALMDNYYLLCLGRILTGLGGSTFYLGIVAESIRYFKKNYSVVISVIIMAGYSGGIIANAPFSWAVTNTSLRFVLVLSAALPLLFLLLYLIPFSTIRKPAVKDVPFSYRNFLNVMKTRSNWTIFLFFAIQWGLYYSIQTVIGKKFLEDFCGFSQNNAAVMFSVTSVLSSVSGFIFAMSSKKIGNRRTPFFKLSGIVTFAVFFITFILTVLDIRNFIPAVLICCLASTSSLSAITVPMMKENNAPNETGCAIALLNSLSYIAVAVFGNVIGGILNLFPPAGDGARLIYTRNAYIAVFAVLLVCAAAVLYWSLRIVEKRNVSK